MKKHFILLLTLVFFTAIAAKATNNADSSIFYLQKAKESKEARRIWDAEKYFQKSIDFNPENEAARLEFANYYCEQRKYNFALQQFNNLLQKNPNHATALPKILDLSFVLRKWTDVISYAIRITSANIKVDKLNYMVAKSHFEEENYGQARKYLLLQIAETPTHKETVTLLGKVYVEMSQYAEAINMYKKTLELNPNDFELLYEIGLLYSAQSNEREAVKYFELAAEKGIKQDLVFLENLGMSYLEFNIPKGVEVLNKVLAKKPGDVEILTQIAQAYYKSENFAVAYDLYSKIFENDNTNVKALYMSGVAMIKKGDKTRGAQICDKAISLDSKLGTLRSQKSVL